MRRDFDPSFVTQYQVAFTELVRLGSVASQKKVDGEETKFEDLKAERLLTVLQALDSDGLTGKETEALEYCLISLNDSLVTPTVDDIVDVQAPAQVPVTYRMRLWAGLFNESVNDVDFSIVGPIISSFGNGSFSSTFQDIALDSRPKITMAFGNGSFALTNNDIGLTHDVYVEPYDISLYLTENITGAPSWSADFDNGTSVPVLTVVGNADSDASTLDADGTPNVVVTVYKNSNSGIAQADGSVIFKKNTVTQNTQTFLDTDNLDGTGSNYKQYTYTSPAAGDLFEVEISEEV